MSLKYVTCAVELIRVMLKDISSRKKQIGIFKDLINSKLIVCSLHRQCSSKTSNFIQKILCKKIGSFNDVNAVNDRSSESSISSSAIRAIRLACNLINLIKPKRLVIAARAARTRGN